LKNTDAVLTNKKADLSMTKGLLFVNHVT